MSWKQNVRRRLSWVDLRNLGASEKAIKAFGDIDPLDIYEMYDGTYRIDGAYEHIAQSAEDLSEYLEATYSEGE